jgi:hypothetical protein
MHSGLVAIIGNILDDGETWTTVGAVDEGIAVAAIRGIKEFAQAVVTGGSIRRDEGVTYGTSLAMGNAESSFMAWWDEFRDNGIDTCQGWSLLTQGSLEASECLARALDLDGHTGAIVEDKTDQVPA